MTTATTDSEIKTDADAAGIRSSALFGLAGLAMLHPAQIYEKNETIAGGICDFCGEPAPALKVFNSAPVAGACYCRKCAPLSETDADWPNAADQ